MSVKFNDYSVEVIDKMNDRINARLEECAGLIESQAKQNTRVDQHDTKNNWKHYVDEGEHVAYIGNPLENAIWEEFGTGEHALNGNGRSGYWVFVKGASGSKNQGKSYTLQEAKKVMAILRSKGLEAYYTNGKKPSRAFHKAYTSTKNRIIKALENALKGM